MTNDEGQTSETIVKQINYIYISPQNKICSINKKLIKFDFKSNHNFDFANVRILAPERNFYGVSFLKCLLPNLLLQQRNLPTSNRVFRAMKNNRKQASN